MRQYIVGNLVIHPANSADPDAVVEVTPELAGWDTINSQVRHLAAARSVAYVERAPTGRGGLRRGTIQRRTIRQHGQTR